MAAAQCNHHTNTVHATPVTIDFTQTPNACFLTCFRSASVRSGAGPSRFPSAANTTHVRSRA